MKAAFVIGIAVLALCAAPAQAKREKLSFGTGACFTEITFDTKKTKAEVVKDTGFLLYEDISSPVAAFPPTPPEGVPANIATFEAECAALKGKIEGLKLAPVKGLEERRAQRLLQIEEACRFGVVRLKGPIDASVYRSFPAPTCERYLDPIEGKTPIEPLLDEIQAAQCKGMDKPADCFKDELGPRDAPDFQQKARNYVADYGWNNCVVDGLLMNQTENEEKILAGLRAAFEKGFKVKTECEEP